MTLIHAKSARIVNEVAKLVLLDGNGALIGQRSEIRVDEAGRDGINFESCFRADARARKLWATC